MTVGIGDPDVARLVDRNAMRLPQLTGSSSGVAKLCQDVALGIELLDPHVVGISDIAVTACIDIEATRPRHLPGRCPEHACAFRHRRRIRLRIMLEVPIQHEAAVAIYDVALSTLAFR